MISGLHSFYFPPIAYFTKIQASQKVYIDETKKFVKKTNRVYILGSERKEFFTVPILKVHSTTAFNEVCIDYTQKWQVRHFRAMQSNYGKSPYFEHYADEIHELLSHKEKYLYELNRAILVWCMKTLGLSTPIIYQEKPNFKIDFIQNLIKQEPKIMKPYQQVFGEAFIPNLSILDLIFCCGPHSSTYL